MKQNHYLLFLLVICLNFAGRGIINAQNHCDIDIATVNITKGEIVPQAVDARLQAKLSQALSKAGLTSVDYDSRFFVAGRFDDAINDVTGGPNQKVLVKTTLTIYIGDAEEQKIFASETFELKGVGSSDQQAYSNALKSINGSNEKLIDFLKEGKQRILDYYDANYTKYLDNARKQMAARNYDEALFYATAIPSCSVGYAQATTLALQIYNQSMNYEAQQLLAKARAAWAADPSADGASVAYSYLSQIDPSASCAPEARVLGDEITQTTKKQWEFENVTKYKDQIELEKRRIDATTQNERRRLEAAKEIAKAYATSRPRVVNRYYFVR